MMHNMVLKQIKDHQALLVLLMLIAVLMAIFGSTLTARAEKLALQPNRDGVNMTSASYDLTWDVVASGGETLTSSSYQVMATVGQPALGTTTSTSYNLKSGYWLLDLLREIFLPLIMKG
jgi:hypothetical protein